MNKISVAEYNKRLEKIRIAKINLAEAEANFHEAEESQTVENCCVCSGLSRWKVEACENCQGKGYL